jgi:nickel/cobalt transporter (NicO) family protein
VIRRILLALSALMAFAAPVLAHPHIFIDAKATIVFDDAGDFAGIRHTWTFDPEFSTWQIQGLDINGDGVTSSEEMQELADETTKGLGEYQFYTFAGEGDETIAMAPAGDAQFVHENGLTTLTLAIAPETPYAILDTLEIAVNDPEYYVAITFTDASTVTLENAPAGCGVRMEPPHDMPMELADQLYALPPEVTTLPPELAAALRGVQGAILVNCAQSVGDASTALDAVNAVAATNAQVFGGPPPEPGLMLPRTGLLGWVAGQQASFYQALNDALARLKTDNNAFWVLGGLSFLYGIFHAAGPGHGKVVISSYVLANEQQVRRGVQLSFLAALLQSAVAIAFALVAAGLLSLTSTAMGRAISWIEIASYSLVAGLGLWLIARKVFGWGSHDHGKTHDDHADQHQAHSHLYDEHDHDHHDHAHQESEHVHAITPAQITGDWREQAAVVLAVGLRPCSGALVVLVFALSQSLLLAGIIAVLLMGLGTGITVAVLASLAVSLKGLTYRLSGGGAFAVSIVWWLEMAGALAVFGFGVVLLLATL